jgi:hypothetical protein
MSIRTTVTLDDDVIEGVREKSRSLGKPFRETLNDLLRTGLSAQQRLPDRRSFRVKPQPMGLRPGLSYDDVEALIEYGEGALHG